MSVRARRCGRSSAKRPWTSCDGDRALPNRGGDALDRGVAHVARRKHAGHARLERTAAGVRAASRARPDRLPVRRNPCAVSRDLAGTASRVRAGPDQHEERVGGDRLFFAAGCSRSTSSLQTALPSPADHRGAGAHLHVRRRLDRPHQVVRHPGPERPRAHDERDAARVAREVQGCLAGRVPAAGDVGVLPASARGPPRPGRRRRRLRRSALSSEGTPKRR